MNLVLLPIWQCNRKHNLTIWQYDIKSNLTFSPVSMLTTCSLQLLRLASRSLGEGRNTSSTSPNSIYPMLSFCIFLRRMKVVKHKDRRHKADTNWSPLPSFFHILILMTLSMNSGYALSLAMSSHETSVGTFYRIMSAHSKSTNDQCTARWLQRVLIRIDEVLTNNQLGSLSSALRQLVKLNSPEIFGCKADADDVFRFQSLADL